MSTIAINNSQDSPYDCNCHMNWSIEASHFHVYSKWNGIGEQELEDMSMNSGKSDSSIVLMMDFVIFVKKGLMKGPMRREEKKIFKEV